MSASVSSVFESAWVGERVLRAVWLGSLTLVFDDVFDDIPDVLLDGRRLTESESRLFIDFVDSGCVFLDPEEVGLSQEGFELLARWATLVPMGGAA